MTSDVNTSIEALAAEDIAGHAAELGALLYACVHDGASVGFVMPYRATDSVAFWLNQVKPGVQACTRAVLVARRGGTIVGSVQLDYDTPPNQPHRAEVRKLLVHPDHRRQGVAQMLMAELHRRAALLGRNLLTLDTRTGDKAEPLYAALGYQSVGVIPGFCRDTMDAGRFDSTTIMYKAL
jgi:GNAT superfamily N-acetyltransferase